MRPHKMPIKWRCLVVLEQNPNRRIPKVAPDLKAQRDVVMKTRRQQAKFREGEGQPVSALWIRLPASRQQKGTEAAMLEESVGLAVPAAFRLRPVGPNPC